jgi:surface polysaccharide O-acyltransferase-like enzyme
VNFTQIIYLIMLQMVGTYIFDKYKKKKKKKKICAALFILLKSLARGSFISHTN